MNATERNGRRQDQLVDRTRRRGRRLVAVFALAAILLTVFVVANGRQGDQLCAITNENRDTLRDILLLAQARSDMPNSTFWTDALARVEPVECSTA